MTDTASGRGSVLVTGATGRVGGQVSAQLAATDVPVRVLARNPAAVASSALPASVDVAVGDLTNPVDVDQALTGIEAVFLVFRSALGDMSARDVIGTIARTEARTDRTGPGSTRAVRRRAGRSATSIINSHARMVGQPEPVTDTVQ